MRYEAKKQLIQWKLCTIVCESPNCHRASLSCCQFDSSTAAYDEFACQRGHPLLSCYRACATTADGRS
jgi:hypothetical protein